MPFRVSSITPTVLIEPVESCASNEGANKNKVVIEALSPGPFLPISRVASIATSGHGCQVKDCVVGIFNSWSLKIGMERASINSKRNRLLDIAPGWLPRESNPIRHLIAYVVPPPPPGKNSNPISRKATETIISQRRMEDTLRSESFVF
ncbi:predicted protein [Histoplasma capsulatum var. duboisii H88]|uniref:Predicted protein n=1 Tax=Ajellomyces capsulatus (strain H88) TaxID=544711 RepID=F0ULV1_AJEC8|nr:predicted protein [Histoplasma capsulatum var. duboisii H88]